MVARIQIRGEEGVTTGKSGSAANHRALQLESPPFARTYEKLYAHFSSSISTPFLLIDLDSSFRVERRWRNPSLFFVHCVSRLPHALLAFYPSGREEERGRVFIQVEALRDWTGRSNIMTGKYMEILSGSVPSPTVWIFPLRRSPFRNFFLQTISTQAIQLILRKLTFRLKKISRFNYRPAFRAAHLDPHTHTHIYKYRKLMTG